MRAIAIQPALFAAVLALPVSAFGQVVHLIEDTVPSSFVDISSVGELLPLVGDGEIGVGSFAGNFVFRPGDWRARSNQTRQTESRPGRAANWWEPWKTS